MPAHDDIPALSGKERLILELLIHGGALYGLDLVRASEGELKRGTVYVTLSRMADKGYVDHRVEDPPPGETGPPRRIYHATGHGQRVFAAWEMLRAQLAPGGAR